MFQFMLDDQLNFDNPIIFFIKYPIVNKAGVPVEEGYKSLEVLAFSRKAPDEVLSEGRVMPDWNLHVGKWHAVTTVGDFCLRVDIHGALILMCPMPVEPFAVQIRMDLTVFHHDPLRHIGGKDGLVDTHYREIIT